MELDSLEQARLRRAMEARLAELHRDITDKLGDAAALNSELDRAADTGDQSVIADAASGDFADARRDLFEYHTGRAALARLDAGKYGLCTDCSVEIPRERLQAQPFAARCVHCQERHERETGFRTTTM